MTEIFNVGALPRTQNITNNRSTGYYTKTYTQRDAKDIFVGPSGITKKQAHPIKFFLSQKAVQFGLKSKEAHEAEFHQIKYDFSTSNDKKEAENKLNEIISYYGSPEKIESIKTRITGTCKDTGCELIICLKDGPRRVLDLPRGWCSPDINLADLLRADDKK